MIQQRQLRQQTITLPLPAAPGIVKNYNNNNNNYNNNQQADITNLLKNVVGGDFMVLEHCDFVGILVRLTLGLSLGSNVGKSDGILDGVRVG